MAQQEHQDQVLGELRKQLARDRTKTTVSFTQLWLVEMTRRRTRHLRKARRFHPEGVPRDRSAGGVVGLLLDGTASTGVG